ncbi:hypothetical protein GCM10009608_33810 [Pseudonocardia alaniniphila]
MRWLVVGVSPPLPCRPSRVAQAQPPGPGLPEHAPSVHTSSAPSAAGISGRWVVRFGRFAVVLGAEPAASGVAQAACAQAAPDRPISSPGLMRDEQTLHVVAYLAVIGTPTSLVSAVRAPPPVAASSTDRRQAPQSGPVLSYFDGMTGLTTA